MDTASTSRIIDVRLDDSSIVRWNADVDHERRVAIFDLLEDNYFAPTSGIAGPFKLTLGMEDVRLIINIGSPGGEALETIRLSLVPFRRVLRDYLAICQSYYQAIRSAGRVQIEAIDMGRRGLHNEGSALLRERLAGKLDLDDNTARRLFTLICVLQIRG